MIRNKAKPLVVNQREKKRNGKESEKNIDKTRGNR